MSSDLRLHEIAESTHRILNPLSLEKLMLVGEIVGLSPRPRVLDLGCGKAEMLSQWAARWHCSGHGVDASAVFLESARSRAASLQVSDLLSFSLGDADDFHTDERFDVVCCVGASWFAGDLARSIDRMRGWAGPDATLVLGEPFWIHEPPPGADAAWDQQFHSLPGLVDWLQSVGLEVVEMVLSSPDDWDRYCAAQWRNMYRWLRANPRGKDAPAVRERLTTSRARYVSMQREYMGWGVFVLEPEL